MAASAAAVVGGGARSRTVASGIAHYAMLTGACQPAGVVLLRAPSSASTGAEDPVVCEPATRRMPLLKWRYQLKRAVYRRSVRRRGYAAPPFSAVTRVAQHVVEGRITSERRRGTRGARPAEQAPRSGYDGGTPRGCMYFSGLKASPAATPSPDWSRRITWSRRGRWARAR